jgi:hypothetical protein
VIKVISQYDDCILNIVVLMNTLIVRTPIGYSDYAADREFEEQFQVMFPYLKAKIKKVAAGSIEQMTTNPSTLITESTTVKELSEKMAERYGREIVILRYTINAWLPIRQSRYWTLKSQNDEARKLACLNPDL